MLNRTVGSSPGKTMILAMIRMYRRHVSPLLPSSCIYTPSCSRYAEIAVKRFGAVRGTWLAVRRVLRCNPFMKGGYDPVPGTEGDEGECSPDAPGENGERQDIR